MEKLMDGMIPAFQMSRELCREGASKNLNLMEWDKLWNINKKIIDLVCPGHTTVNEERRVLLHLTDGPDKPFVRIIPKHKKYEGAGEKATTYTRSIWIDFADAEYISAEEEITLMDWGNAIVKDIQKNQDGVITELTGVLNLQGFEKIMSGDMSCHQFFPFYLPTCTLSL